FTGNVSEQGLFVRGDATAPIGDQIRVDLTLPSGAVLALTGRIANIVTPAEAAGRGVAPGMGVALDSLEGEARRAFESLLATARSHLPRPAELAPDGNPSPPRPPRPPSIAPTDDVHHSVVMRAIDAASILDEPASRTSQLTAPP